MLVNPLPLQEIIGGIILPMCQGDNYKFHAAGREDIDVYNFLLLRSYYCAITSLSSSPFNSVQVRMLGTGRPFLVEIQNARIFSVDVLLKDMEKKINSLESQYVSTVRLNMEIF